MYKQTVCYVDKTSKNMFDGHPKTWPQPSPVADDGHSATKVLSCAENFEYILCNIIMPCVDPVSFQVFVMYLSTYMLVMTAVDRYLSVCHPLSSFNTSSKTKVYLMIAFAYALSAVLSLPQPIIFKYQEQPGLNVYDCWAYFDPVWTLNLYVTSFTVAVYLIPLLILIYTYVSICYAIWQKQKHSQPQCQLDALEKTTCLSQAPNARGGGCTGTGGIPGKKSNSSGSRTHSTSSPYDPRTGGPALPGEKQTRCLSCTGGCATNRLTSTNIHYHNHIHHHHHYQHSSKYGAGPGTRCALMEGATGITPSGLLSAGRFREKREGRHGRAEREEGGRKRSSSKSLANKRQTVGRSNAIRRRVNLVVTAANGSTRSSTGSVRGLSRAKMKTVKLTFVVIMAYVVCWTPFFVSQLWWLYDESQENSTSVLVLTLVLVCVSDFVSVVISMPVSVLVSIVISVPVSIVISVPVSVVISVPVSVHVSVVISELVSVVISVPVSVIISVPVSELVSVVISVPVSVVISVPVSELVSVVISVHVSVVISVHVSVVISVHVSVIISVPVSELVSVVISVPVSVVISVPVSELVSVVISVHVSVVISVHVSVVISVHVSVVISVPVSVVISVPVSVVISVTVSVVISVPVSVVISVTVSVVISVPVSVVISVLS